MSQYKPDGTNFPTVTVTNGSPNVVIHGVDATAEIQTLDYFYVYGAGTGRYEVSATPPVYATGNTTIVLTTNYAGTTSSSAVGVFHRDFTGIYSFPLMYDGDLEVAAIMRRLAQLIEAAIADVSVSSATISGNLTFTGTGNRIRGDFSNAILLNRVLIQSSITNGNTNVGVIPNGTSLITALNLYATADPTNSTVAQLLSNSTEASLRAGVTGTGTALPLTIYTNALERIRVLTTGDVGIGATAPNHVAAGRALTIQGTGTTALELATSAADAAAVVIGGLEGWYATNSASHNRIAALQIVSEGGTANQRGGAFVFNTKINGATTFSEKARLMNTGDFGIGTATPNYNAAGKAITVESATVPAIELATSAADAAAVVVGSYDAWYKTNSASHNRIGAFQIVTEGVTANQRGGAFVWSSKINGATTFAEKMRITNAGDLGLGTATPNYNATGQALTIQSATGGVVELAASTADAAAVVVGSYEGNYRTNSASHQRIAALQVVSEGATANQRGGAFVFSSKINGATTFAEKMRLTNAGDLGIGTATPNYNAAGKGFTIQSATGGAIELATSAADAAAVVVGSYEGNYRTNSASHQRIGAFQIITEGATANQRGGAFTWSSKVNGATTFAEKMRLMNTGDLGIGTVTPNYVGFGKAFTVESTSTSLSAGLEICGNANDADATGVGYIYYRYQTNSSSHRNVAAFGASSDGTTANQRGGALQFFTKTDASTTLSERMRVTGAGDLGLGTTTPNYLTFGRVMGIESPAGIPGVVFATSQADAQGLFIAALEGWYKTNSATHNRIATILYGTEGTTANQRGGNMQFYTKPDGVAAIASRMIINQAGDIGVGTTTPNRAGLSRSLAVETGGAAGPGITLSSTAADATGVFVGQIIGYYTTNSASHNTIADIVIKTEGGTANQRGGYISFFTKPNASTSLTERLCINQAGDVIVNPTAGNNPIANRINGYSFLGASNIGSFLQRGPVNSAGFGINATSGIHFNFYTDNGSTNIAAGAISSNGSTTTFTTSSDYRLKENLIPLDNALELLEKLPVYRFNFIGSEDIHDGFLAHEAAEVVPQAVVGEKDAVDEEGNIQRQLLDYSKIVPVLTAAVKDLSAMVKELQAEIKVLKENN